MVVVRGVVVVVVGLEVTGYERGGGLEVTGRGVEGGMGRVVLW